MEPNFCIENHRLLGARQVPSPNFNSRPVDEEISLLVIHNISLPPGRFGSGHIELFFQNRLPVDADPFYQEIKDLQVSSHLLIERDGNAVQFVDFDQRAWHAGASSFDGRDSCNDFAIGIELEGTDTEPYTDAQYQALVAITRQLQQRYPAITDSRITGHSDIAPGRKTDPGPAFDWQYYRALLAA